LPGELDFLNDNIIPVEMDIDLPDWRDEVMLTKEWYNLFNQFKGTYQYDVVISNKIQPLAMIKKLLEFTPDRRDSFNTIPIPIIANPMLFAMVRDRAKDVFMFPHDAECVEWSLVYADSVVVISPNEIDMIRSSLMKMFNASTVREIMKKVTWNSGFDESYFKSCLDSAGKEESWAGNKVVLSASRLAPVKQLPLVTEVFEKLITLTGARCVINTPDTEGAELDAINEIRRSTELYTGASYSDYLRRLNSADVFVVASKLESLCWTMFEAFAAGCIVAGIRQPWMRGLIPEDYPFMYRDKDELLLGLQAILESTSDSRNKYAPFREQVLSSISWDAYVSRWSQIIRYEVARSQGTFISKHDGKDSMLGLSISTLRGDETLQEAENQVKLHSSSNSSPHRFALYAVQQYRRGEYAIPNDNSSDSAI